mmetsp:Transcript_17836/g.40925  ORF Transcript_17836/g.40925 Transcript_17836/m.40925 type:complete len:218 (+) Transcript_17836:202-855(+)|eukprot:CAMPEP_0201276206 /NCGR_PEP_ID=MMETSP0853-20130426/55324_1 /ASSEMBLY_ACC=CAM_ASM_000640 /TAXON_ID=183588 /ORGANISM="Pseudo-nitzschia fraudulenta, Strain WWA7" /LENGTH=217 /DNA_ID=CAMNT_0047584051 /DNA_START=195 /DNA_END=848 /DNA_ORIENTATION=-
MEAGPLRLQPPSLSPLSVRSGIPVRRVSNDWMRETVQVLSYLVPAPGLDPRQDQACPRPVVAGAVVVALSGNESKITRCVFYRPRFVLDRSIDLEPPLLPKVPPLQDPFPAHQSEVRLMGGRSKGHAFLQHSGGVATVLVRPRQAHQEAPTRSAVQAVDEIDPLSHGLASSLQHGHLGWLVVFVLLRRLLSSAPAPIAVVANDRRWLADNEVVRTAI